MENHQFIEAIAQLQEEIKVLHLHRANPAMVENILVEAYGTKMKLQELATISVPEPNVLAIQPWDKGVVMATQAALKKSELNLNPVADGDRLRLIFPPLTAEKRQELVKLLHKKLEEARIHVRQIREELLKKIKQQKKDSQISEDEYWRQEKEIQRQVDEINTEISKLGECKEGELIKI